MAAVVMAKGEEEEEEEEEEQEEAHEHVDRMLQWIGLFGHTTFCKEGQEKTNPR